MKQEEKDKLLDVQYNIIHDREAKLKATDYIAAKLSEGKATTEEYADQIAERQVWRDEINAAQSEIARLGAIEVEVEVFDDAGLAR